MLVAEDRRPPTARLRSPRAALPAGPPARPTRSRRSWWFLGGAVAAFGAALVVAVSLFATDRLPGQSATGSISLSQTQQVEETLAQAATYQDQGQSVQAAQLYQSVLAAHPDDEVALAQLGWLEYESGRPSNNVALISAGRTKAQPGGEARLRRLCGPALPRHRPSPTGRQRRRCGGPVPPVPGRRAADGPGRTGGPGDQRAFQKAGLPLPSALATG